MMRCFSGRIPIPVSVTSNATTAGAVERTGCVGVQPEVARATRMSHAAVLGELDRVRKQILQNLLEPLGVGGDAAQVAVDRDLERKAAPLRLVTERAGDGFLEVAQRNFLRVDRHRAGFDLRKVEDVADEIEQVAARAVNCARELDLTMRQVAVGIVRELLAKDQDAVERRAQLVRHVREKFRLVLRGQRKLGRLLLERAPGLLDLVVLALDLGVLLGELLGLLLELLVRQLQLLLLRLQLGGQLLRLLEQALPSASSLRCC